MLELNLDILVFGEKLFVGNLLYIRNYILCILFTLIKLIVQVH